MKSEIFRKIFAIYSIILGISALIATFRSEPNPITIFIELLFVISGIFLLASNRNSVKKIVLIVLVILYFIGLLGSIPFIIYDRIVGLIAFGIFCIPFILGILYFVSKKKENS